jgi:hypothetical protein
MNKQLITVLQYDEVEFENMRIERFLRWCMSISSRRQVPLQAIMANTSISKYYNHELGKLENNFLQLVKGKTDFLEQKALREFYEIIIVDVFKHYPDALLEQCRKINIDNQITLN